MSNTCYVCLEELNNKSISTGCSCNMKLHKKCLKMMIESKNATCSICKTDFCCNALSKCFQQHELINILVGYKVPTIPEDCVIVDKLTAIIIDNNFIKTDDLFMEYVIRPKKLIINDDNENIILYCPKRNYFNYMKALKVLCKGDDDEMHVNTKKHLHKPTKMFRKQQRRNCTHYKR